MEKGIAKIDDALNLGDRLTIRNGSLIAENASFQIKNIVSLSIETFMRIPDAGAFLTSLMWSFWPAVVVGLISFYLGGSSEINNIVSSLYFPEAYCRGLSEGAITYAILVVVIYLSILGWIRCFRFLEVITSAGTTFGLHSSDRDGLYKVKEAIEMAMRDGSQAVYNIDNRGDRIKITGDVDARSTTTSISNSSGVSVVGHAGQQVTQSNEANVQGLQDVSQLLKVVETSKAANAELLKAQLEIIRDHLDGRRTRNEAQGACRKFIENAGGLIHAGSSVMELIGRLLGTIG
jgi:hypothetical protein